MVDHTRKGGQEIPPVLGGQGRSIVDIIGSAHWLMILLLVLVVWAIAWLL